MTMSSRMTKILLILLNKKIENSTKTLGIRENNILLNPTDHLSNPVDIALKKFENHPSIVNIKEKVAVDTKFSFKKVEILDTKTEIRNLDIKKAGTFSNISAKQLKQVEEIIAEPSGIKKLYKMRNFLLN